MQKEPATQQEWQEAVASVAFVLLLDSAHKYGLIKTGPRIDVGRCVDILTRGQVLGYMPPTFEELIARFVRVGPENEEPQEKRQAH